MVAAMRAAVDAAPLTLDELAGVGVGSPGNVDSTAGTVANARNDFDFKRATFSSDLQQVPNTDVACRLDWLIVRLHSAEFTSARSQGARFEESRRPEPFVDADAIHGVSHYTALCQQRSFGEPANSFGQPEVRAQTN